MIDKECVVDYMFNFDVTEAGPWKRVVLAHCPPACLPEELERLGSDSQKQDAIEREHS